jgi:hypothetical protein
MEPEEIAEEDFLTQLSINPELSSEQQADVTALIRNYEPLFVQPTAALPFTDKCEHFIPTDDAPPIKCNPRRVSPQKQEVIDKEVQRLLDYEIIEPCDGPWAFPVACVWQKSKWRFCIDYRKLNLVTTRDSYPIPDQDEHMEFCKDKAFRSQLDALMGYHQIEITAADRDKTTFVTTKGL